MNNKGDTLLISLILCTAILISSSVLYKVCYNNIKNRIFIEEEKKAIKAAELASNEVQYLLKEDSYNSFNKLNTFLSDKSKKWFLSTKNLSSEERISYNDLEYSAEILELYPLKYYSLLKIKTYGYTKNFKKSLIVQLKIEGTALVSSLKPEYSLYIASDGYDFNQKIQIIGDVYFGGGFRFNSNASGSIINGNIKTGLGSTVSEFNGRVIVNGKAFFQTPIKVQNDSLIFNSKAGFLKNCELLKSIAINDKGYFAGSIQTNKVDMRQNDAIHKGTCSPFNFANATSVISNSSLDIANELNMTPGNDDPIKVNYNGMSSFVLDFSALGITELTGKNLQLVYDFNKNKLWNGYLVIRISNNKIPQFNKTEGTFNGKVIFIVEASVPVNGKWYSSSDTSETIIYVKKGTISQLGWDNTMNGFIYVEDQGDIQYSFNKNSKLNGFICHTNKAGFQANTSNMVTIEYQESLINKWSSIGLISLPSYNVKEVFTMIDYKIRPVIISTYLL
jgi:hypothetical protein